MQVYSVVSGIGFLSLKSHQESIGEPFLSMMALLIILMAPLLVVIMVVVQNYAAPEHKVYSVMALMFMLLLAGITSSVNFVVLLVSNQADATGRLAIGISVIGWGAVGSVLLLLLALVFGRTQPVASGCHAG